MNSGDDADEGWAEGAKDVGKERERARRERREARDAAGGTGTRDRR